MVQRAARVETTPPVSADRTVARTPEALGSEWTLLRNCRLRPLDRNSVPTLLVHPGQGIAVLDVAPSVTPDAVEAVHARLNAARFEGIFAGHLPVVHLQCTPRQMPSLPAMLEDAFAAVPPLDLPGGDAWAGFAARALLAEQTLPRREAQSQAPDQGMEMLRRPQPRRTAVFGTLVAVFLCLLALAGVLALVLNGGPHLRPASDPDSASPPVAAAPPPVAVAPPSVAVAPPPIAAVPPPVVAAPPEPAVEPVPPALQAAPAAPERAAAPAIAPPLPLPPNPIPPPPPAPPAESSVPAHQPPPAAVLPPPTLPPLLTVPDPPPMQAVPQRAAPPTPPRRAESSAPASRKPAERPAPPPRRQPQESGGRLQAGASTVPEASPSRCARISAGIGSGAPLSDADIRFFNESCVRW